MMHTGVITTSASQNVTSGRCSLVCGGQMVDPRRTSVTGWLERRNSNRRAPEQIAKHLKFVYKTLKYSFLIAAILAFLIKDLF